MALFQSRKTRPGRTAEIRPSGSLVRRSVASLHNRSIAARLAICLVAILAMLAAVRGWEIPFPYRLGDRVEEGITARIEFERVDVPATEIARINAENRVPLFFTRIGTPNENLHTKLRVALTDIAQNTRVRDLSPATRLSFGLRVTDDATEPEPSRSPGTAPESSPASETPAVAPGGSRSAPTESPIPPAGEPAPAVPEGNAEVARTNSPPEAVGGTTTPDGGTAAGPNPAAGPDTVAGGNAQPGNAKGAAPPDADPAEKEPAPPLADPRETNGDFLALRALVTSKGATAGNRIDDILSEFVRFSAPIRNDGLVDPAEIERLGIRPDQEITVVWKDDRTDDTIQPDTVNLRESLKDTGLLGKSWEQYKDLQQIRPQLTRWLLSQAVPSLRYDSAATQKARIRERDAVPPVTIRYNAGNVLSPPGKPIDEEALQILRAEFDKIDESIGIDQRVLRMSAVFLMLTVLAGLNGFYLLHNEPRVVRSLGRLSIFLASLVVAVALGRLLSFDPWRAEVIPYIAVVMVFAIAYNQVLATIVGFTLAIILSVAIGGELSQFIVLMSVAAVSVIPLSSVPSRSTIIKVGFWTGVAYFVVKCGLAVINSQAPYEIWRDTMLLFAGLRGGGWCLVAGYLVAGSLPFIEKSFGVVTDISLLEMSDISHPLLQELVRRAPGTYNHSIAVATIGETAADRIGANGLLVRVGAYYHDIGKMLKPQYFVENMTEGSTSRHEHLAPAMSTLIIIGHVKDGVDLARRHNLPGPLIDFIEQHHGTTLVEYFYREASRLAEQQPDHRGDVTESSFRYPGPKPQTRELGVMMIADAVESASRTLSEPTPKRIEGLVHNIIMKRLLDGQFDECSLTLNELRVIEDSLTKSLIGIYHGRIKYPEQRIA